MSAQSKCVEEPRNRQWMTLVLLLLFGLSLRLIFYSGFFGSDEVTYTERAVAWLLGDRSIPEYVGANRLGITLPVAAIMSVFGRSEFTANLWSLSCALGELLLVWLIGMRLGGRSLAIAATLLLALTPLHVHYSGRLHADTPVSFFMTLSAAAVLLGRNDKLLGAMISGVAAGFVFWIKPPVVIFSFVIVILMALKRKTTAHYLVWGAGAALVVAMNLAMMWIYAGDPFFVLKAMSKRLDLFVDMRDLDRRPHAYPVWLLADMRFTWLLGWFALLGMVTGCRDANLRPMAINIMTWLIGLVLIFSLWPASLKPFDFIFKQSNYLTMFLAPAALGGGLLISRLRPVTRIVVMTIYGIGGLFLSALLQADIQTFTANARSVPDFIKQEPDATYYVGMVGQMAVDFDNALAARDRSELTRQNVKALVEASSATREVKAIMVLDPISGPHRRDPPLSEISPDMTCWKSVGSIQPSELSTFARLAVWFVRAALKSLPVSTLRAKLDSFMLLEPASVLKLDAQCDAMRDK